MEYGNTFLLFCLEGQVVCPKFQNYLFRPRTIELLTLVSDQHVVPAVTSTLQQVQFSLFNYTRRHEITWGGEGQFRVVAALSQKKTLRAVREWPRDWLGHFREERKCPAGNRSPISSVVLVIIPTELSAA
jgi:hypothetical protein